MAKFICAISGLEISVQHFPLYLDSMECKHPIFSMPARKLPLYYHKWVNGELNSKVDNYLLFLALLNSTELIDWRIPVKVTEDTPSLVASYMPRLYAITQKISGIKHPSFSIPSIAITANTNTLANVKYWIKSWEDSYEDFISGLKKGELRSKLARREQGLEKLIKSPGIKPEKYAHILAAWASDAGQFPEFMMASPHTNETISISAYWQDIIVRCYRTENILSIPPKDLAELTEHCEQYIEHGTIFSYHLFAALEEGKSRQTNFYGLGDMIALSNATPGFRILDTKTNVEDANIAVMIDSAPISKPERKDYKSDFAYLKAKAKWELSQQYSESAK